MRFPLRSSAPVLLGVALCLSPASGRAEDEARAIEPAAPHALGRVLVAGSAATGPTLLASSGYGYTESVLGMGEVHHRIAGGLALDERPLRWLDFTLRLDGRYDAHVIPGQATDSGLVGDPRLYARVDQAWAGGLRLGARAGLWVPGRNAPSLDWGAISPELVGMASYVPASAPVVLTVNVGYRLDCSAHSAPDAAMLSPSDRLALEVSAFNEVLAGVAATLGRGPAQGFLEASAELLVGAGAPAPKASPILLGGGARFALARNLRLEAEVEVSPSSRPDVSPSAPLVPIPPRVAAWLGLTYRFGAESVPPAPPQAQAPARPAPVAAPPPPPRTVELGGQVSASDAGKLLELRVEIASGGRAREVTLDEGRFRAEGKPGEELTVSAEAKGYSPGQATVTLAAETPNHLELTLERRPPRGQIRGLVRSLRGTIVGADIVVEPEPASSPQAATPETQRLRAEGGRFEIDVAPGRYRVTIAVPGYEIQKRKVEVEEDGVTVLNVDSQDGAMIAAGRRPRLLALPVLCLGVVVGPACRREPPVATALEVAGTAERTRADAGSAVIPGTPFAIGDTLRTGAASGARLALVGGGVIRVGEKARLRFQRGAVVGQRAPDIAVELGSAEVDETVSDMSIVTAVGPARIDRGAHVRVRTDGQTASLEVLVGRAVMLDAGQEVAIDAGHGVRIRLGSAEIERFALTVGEAVVEQGRARADATAPSAAEIADGGSTAAEAPAAKPRQTDPAIAAPPPPSEGAAEATSHSQRADTGHADITLTAGESATVHDGRPPATVRLRIEGLCSGEAIVELGGHGHHHERLVGARAVVVRLQPGVLPYRVRCASDRSRAEPRASGVLSLRHDNGYVPLARHAPVDVIDADGRRYTVLFQTRLPRLTLAWPAAPSAARLELHLESTTGARVIEAESPPHPLPTGSVQEGTYTFWYRGPDGKQSPKTTVSIRFDNTAPTAQFFRAPRGAEKGPLAAIAIDGVTVDGAKVSVGGQPIAVDGHGRFRTEAAPLAGDEAVAVRLEHPRTGVHYYVRRRAEAR